MRLVKGLYERGMASEDMRQLFRFIDWIMELPPALDTLFWQEIHQYEEEKRMPFVTTPERLARQESYLAGIDVSLEVKFGAEGLALMPEIREIQDHEVLWEVLQAIRTVTTPDELRRIWAPKRRPKKRRRT